MSTIACTSLREYLTYWAIGLLLGLVICWNIGSYVDRRRRR